MAGQSPKSLDAFANLKAVCEEHLPGNYEIEIVDLIEHPATAANDDVLAVPTLVRCLPPPSRRIIGTLSNTMVDVISTFDAPQQSTRNVWVSPGCVPPA